MESRHSHGRSHSRGRSRSRGRGPTHESQQHYGTHHRDACNYCGRPLALTEARASGRSTHYVPPAGTCKRCGAASYCSPEHQRADYARHKTLCRALEGLHHYSDADLEDRAIAWRTLAQTRVTHIADGDTITIADVPGVTKDRKALYIRFDGIDAPEVYHPNYKVGAASGGSTDASPQHLVGQPWGEEARALVELLAPANSVVRLGVKPRAFDQTTSNDKYGRTVADVWAQQPDGSWVWLQEALLYTGLAQRLDEYDRTARALAPSRPERLRVEALDLDAHLARERRVGQWLALDQGHEPLSPHEWRHTTPERREAERESWGVALVEFEASFDEGSDSDSDGGGNNAPPSVATAQRRRNAWGRVRRTMARAGKAALVHGAKGAIKGAIMCAPGGPEAAAACMARQGGTEAARGAARATVRSVARETARSTAQQR